MTQAKVLGIRDHYNLQFNVSEVAQTLQTPFNCGAYGELCDMVSAGDARDYACGVWHALDDRHTVSEVVGDAFHYLEDVGDSCSVESHWCEEICGVRDVLSCSGVLVQGQCLPLAVCDFQTLSHIQGFGFLGPVSN